MPSPRRARLTGEGQMTVFFNNKKRPIYEDPVKQNYYILDARGKRRLAKPKVGFILNKGVPRAVTSGNIPNIPVNLRHKKISSVNVTNALLEAQKALGACKSQRTANAAASAALQTAAVTNNQNKIKNAANIAVNHSKNNPNAPSAQSANAGFMGALAVAGKTLLPLAAGMPNLSPAKQEKVAKAVNNAVVNAGNNSPNVVNAATKAAVQTLSGNLSQVKENIAMIKAAQAAANAAAKHGNGTNAANAASQAAIIVAQSPNATPAKIEKAANAAANAVASGQNTPAVAAANAAAAANANKPAAAVNAAAKLNTKENLNKLLNEYNANRAKAFKKFSLKAHPNKGGNANYFQKVSGLYTTHYKNVQEANVAAKQANENAKAAANAAKAEANKAAANAAAQAQANANKAAQNAANQAKRNQEAANAAAKAQANANAAAANAAAKAQANASAANAAAKAQANANAANAAAKAQANANAAAANAAAKAQENAKAAENAAKAAQNAANKAAANAAEAAKTKNAENKAAANAAAKVAQNAANKAAANAAAANKLAFNALPGTNNKSLFNNNAKAKENEFQNSHEILPHTTMNNFLKNYKIVGYPKNLMINVTANKSANFARRFLSSKLSAGRNKAQQITPYGSKYPNKHPWANMLNNINAYNLTNAQKNMIRRINIALAAQPSVSAFGGKRNSVNFNISGLSRNNAIKKQKNYLKKKSNNAAAAKANNNAASAASRKNNKPKNNNAAERKKKENENMKKFLATGGF